MFEGSTYKTGRVALAAERSAGHLQRRHHRSRKPGRAVPSTRAVSRTCCSPNAEQQRRGDRRGRRPRRRAAHGRRPLRRRSDTPVTATLDRSRASGCRCLMTGLTQASLRWRWRSARVRLARPVERSAAGADAARRRAAAQPTTTPCQPLLRSARADRAVRRSARLPAISCPAPRTGRARLISPARKSTPAPRARSSANAIASRSAAASSPAGYRVIVDVFVEFGPRARRGDLAARHPARRQAAGRSSTQERLSSVENLYRLSLDPTTAVRRDQPDHQGRGSRRHARDRQRVRRRPPTRASPGWCCSARGEMRFHPTPETEKGQVKIFCGSETLDARFDAAFIRVDPSDFERPRGVGRADRRATRRCPRRAQGQRGVPRRLAEVVSGRPRRSEPRRVVAAAGPRRLPRRSPHAPLRHADLRPLADRSRRHHALRSQAAPQHRRLRVGRHAGAPRPLLQRRRLPRLRRPRLRHRPRRLAGPAVARRRRDGARPRARPDAGHDFAAPGRLARRPIDHERSRSAGCSASASTARTSS